MLAAWCKAYNPEQVFCGAAMLREWSLFFRVLCNIIAPIIELCS